VARSIAIPILVTLLMPLPATPVPVRVKDLASLEGVRENQLVGYGLVVGLAGTGDRRQTVFSVQSLTNLLQRMGVAVSPSAIRVNNVAAVMVTANLPPFSQPGNRIDITVASMGDASNLQGGLLVLTPLRGPDGQVYAVAQGALVTGGFVSGRGGNSQTVNHPTVGRIAGGALIERKGPGVELTEKLRLQLHRADFTTAARLAAAVNKKFGGDQSAVAKAENSVVVAINLPREFSARPIDFIAALEAVTFEADQVAKIVVNERTGTIVMGKQVRIAPASVLHGSLTVAIQTTFAVSQPAPFSSGQTKVTPEVNVKAKEDSARNVTLQDGATVEDLVRALTAIGSTARDIISVLQSLKAHGALEAELEII